MIVENRTTCIISCIIDEVSFLLGLDFHDTWSMAKKERRSEERQGAARRREEGERRKQERKGRRWEWDRKKSVEKISSLSAYAHTVYTCTQAQVQ